MPIREWINSLILQSKKPTPEQLAQLIDQAGTAPFAEDLLEVDQPLWGGFWQGDVISPGYRLPAVELALLRATRLDLTWPEGTAVPQFLADLRQAIADPQAGIWTLIVAGEPCVVFVTGDRRLEIGDWRLETVVVWYCAATERLHAGYRTGIEVLNFSGAVEQRPVGDAGAMHLKGASHRKLVQPNWLEQISVQEEISGDQPLATRLDAEILRIRQRGRS